MNCYLSSFPVFKGGKKKKLHWILQMQNLTMQAEVFYADYLPQANFYNS